MRTMLIVIGTLLKAVLIIFFLIRAVVTLVQQRDASFKRKALIQFYTGCGILIGITAIEYFIAFAIPTDI